MGNSKFAKDESKRTGDSIKKIKATWHAARNDEMSDGGLPERLTKKIASGFKALLDGAKKKK